MLGSRPLALNTDGSSSLAYARTPAKGLLKNRSALQENALYFEPMTVNAKGKANLLQTPFQPGTHARKGMQTAKPVVLVSKPLGDKTPFPNRQLPLQTPAPQAAKISKLSMLDPALSKTPGSLLLPSARRKSLRLPRSASKKFTTPTQQGNHWDVSDGEVDADVSTGSAEAQDAEVEDYDEIEYMPPKVPEQPYEPSFDMPNYKEAGLTLLDIARCDLYDDTTDLYYTAPIESEIDVEELLKTSGGFDLNTLPLPELDSDDDDLFFPVPNPKSNTRPESAMSKSTATTHRVGTTRHATSSPSTSRPPTRATSTSRASTPVAATQRPPIATRSTRHTETSLVHGRSTPSNEGSTGSATVTSRPGTSTGVRAPTTRRQPAPVQPVRTRMLTRSATREAIVAPTTTTRVGTRINTRGAATRSKVDPSQNAGQDGRAIDQDIVFSVQSELDDAFQFDV